jgi:hypothetical protein
MSNDGQVLDRAGRPVRVGSIVRVLALSAEFLASLPDGERARVSEMIGASFAVDEIDKWGLAWVTKSWEVGDGEYDAHGIALASSEMELVYDASRSATDPAA